MFDTAPKASPVRMYLQAVKRIPLNIDMQANHLF